MDNYTATELAYKNGYEQGKKDAVKHGFWKQEPPIVLGGVTWNFCSICGSSQGTKWMNYCPNCGAKMDEVTP